MLTVMAFLYLFFILFALVQGEAPWAHEAVFYVCCSALQHKALQAGIGCGRGAHSGFPCSKIYLFAAVYTVLVKNKYIHYNYVIYSL